MVHDDDVGYGGHGAEDHDVADRGLGAAAGVADDDVLFSREEAVFFGDDAGVTT